MKLTTQQSNVLKLINRTLKNDEGWCQCSEIVFDKLIVPMPDELVEKNGTKVKLTEEALLILKWL